MYHVSPMSVYATIQDCMNFMEIGGTTVHQYTNDDLETMLRILWERIAQSVASGPPQGALTSLKVCGIEEMLHGLRVYMSISCRERRLLRCKAACGTSCLIGCYVMDSGVRGLYTPISRVAKGALPRGEIGLSARILWLTDVDDAAVELVTRLWNENPKNPVKIEVLDETPGSIPIAVGAAG